MSSQESRRVEEVVTDLEKWRGNANRQRDQELAQVDEEINRIEAHVANLQAQLSALSSYREEVRRRADQVGAEEKRRVYDGVFEVMGAQARELGERSTARAAQQTQRLAAEFAALREGAFASQLAEYEQFKKVLEPTLGAMPASYRRVVTTHHEALVRTLREEIAERLAAPLPLSVPQLDLDLVCSVDAPDGVAEVVMIVMPVAEEITTYDGNEGLALGLALRVTQGALRACAKLGVEGVLPERGGHRGLLVMELELAGGEPDLVASTFTEAIREAVGNAPELAAAQVALEPRWMPIEHLVPPDEGDEDEPATEVREVSHA